MRKSLVLLMATACALSLAIPTSVLAKKEIVTANLPLAQGGTVEVDLINGSLNITGRGGADVEMTAKVKGGLETFKYESDGKVATFKQIPPKFRLRWDGNVDLTLSVPEGIRLRVDGVNLDIDTRGLTGILRVEAVNGKISISGVTDGVYVETVNGRITLEDISGEVEAETVNGAIRITGGLVSEANLTTMNGAIDWSSVPEAKATIRCETHGGSITVLIPSGLNSTVHAETFSGHISSEFESERRSRRSQDVTFELGSGKNPVTYRLSSFSGSIDIETMN